MFDAEKMNNLACLSFCEKAIENYKIIGNVSKIRKLEKKFYELKTTYRYREFSSKIDLTDHIKECIKIAKDVSKVNPEDIIKIFMYSKDIF